MSYKCSVAKEGVSIHIQTDLQQPKERAKEKVK